MTERDLESQTANYPVRGFLHYIAWTLVTGKTREREREREKSHTYVLLVEKIWRSATKNNFMFQRCVVGGSLEVWLLYCLVSVFFIFSPILYPEHLILNLLLLIPVIYYNTFMSSDNLVLKDKIVLNLF